jgi:hypothetical protein
VNSVATTYFISDSYAKCSCVAGVIGYCNHTMALLHFIDHTIKIGAEVFPEHGTCTENPQQWHRPRTLGIKSEPIMGYSVINPTYREKNYLLELDVHSMRLGNHM